MKISIITISKNAQNDIEKTIHSVSSQTYQNIEYIIIDGASTDGTMSIIKKYHDNISHIISEPDSGIYDAMNKGIKAATGDVLYFLNAGDLLCDKNVIHKVVTAFRKSESDIVYGKSIYRNIPSNVGNRYTDRKFVFKNKLDVAKHVSPQQCFFYKKEAFSKIGKFDTTYKVAADMDWFLRSLKNNITNHYIDTNICLCDLTGISSNQHIKERVAIFWKNMTKFEFLEYSIFAICRQFSRAINGERLH